MTIASGITRERFGLLFAVMLVAAAGNTALQSLMPAIGRHLGIADIWIAVAFSLSAVIWVATAPVWARRADRRGRRALMRLGLSGFIASMLVCGAVLAAGLGGLIGPSLVFIIFLFGRAIYGMFGSAAPPAIQAYIAARSDGESRTRNLAAIASSFGLGTIIGPALAPLFIFRPLGLSGPLFVFAAIGVVVLAALIARLPDDTPLHAGRGGIADYPAQGASGPDHIDDDGADARLRWRDPRLWRWLVIGVIGGHGHAALLGVIGFLVIDRLRLTIEEAQHAIAIVLMGGAAATLLGQWGLIPRLRLGPRHLVSWGALVAATGALATGLADTLYGISLGFAVASLGFGLFRPGFTSGASLAVRRSEQNAVAGMVTSVNGLAYIAAPAAGVALYGAWLPLPFAVVSLVMIGLAIWIAFSPSDPAA
ncbi:MFS transporter [Allosphingosinicella deserti]|uniref:MFS transporter n=1 Tax=Allosphingosinicella deserti TaxID=2116704 RepID=A0A2P7QWB9_9SPHN|nr:MFS transporter [Sphingomonas deserti]PSJ42262.1 MFS transporter [Sphingomonas deserti]